MADTKPKPNLNWRLLLPSLVLFLGLGVVLGDFYFFYREGPLPQSRPVLVEKGQSLKSVARTLAAEEVIDMPATFYWTARLSGAARDIRAGEYLIPAGASQAEVLKILRKGEVILHKFTLPEGLSSRQAVDLIKANLVLSGEVSEIPEEGTLLPETYLFPRGTTRDQLLGQMQAKQDELLKVLFGEYGTAAPLEDENQILTLASIVEEETAIPDERRMIAGVFLNRLREGMRLQSDPTVIYGLTGGYPLGRPLRQSELLKDTPYNTYIHYGLPPGPISNPGRAAIEAVFNPAPTRALYFVADGSGGHVFAETLEEHNQNVKKWRKFRRKNGLN